MEKILSFFKKPKPEVPPVESPTEANIIGLSGGGTMGILQLNAIKASGYDPIKNPPDLIVATSVGAITAVAIALGVPIEQIYNDFEMLANRIFSKKKRLPVFYDIDNAVEVINSYLNGALVKDLKCEVMITTVNLVTDNRCQTLYLSSKKENVQNMRVADFIRPSFSAPTFFKHQLDEKRRRVLSDGGVGFQNYPITQTIIQAYVNGLMDKDTVNFWAFGTGLDLPSWDDVNKAYVRHSKRNWVKDVLSFLSLTSGGFARKSSYLESIYAGLYFGERDDHVNFQCWDCVYPVSKIKLDDVKRIPELMRVPAQRITKEWLDNYTFQ